MITERTTAILLFTSYLSKTTSSEVRPLSIAEWNRLAYWLHTKSINPEDFLTKKSTDLLAGFQDKKISLERINNLLNRKPALAISLEKWSKAGVWIINRSDSEYPKQLKNKLIENAPAILFGIGNNLLLNKNYIGVVGSRKIDDNELLYAKKMGGDISRNSYGVVSGGAKGVDESAMLGALENGGFSLGFVADSLIKKSTSGVFRKHIINNSLCLLSPFNPEAGFNVGNAMARNKLIYAQSAAVIVAKSDIKGGTWEGAKENLKKEWVPVWVINNDEKGNNKLINLGAKKLSTSTDLNIAELINTTNNSEPDLFSSVYLPKNQAVVNEKKNKED